MDLFAERLLVDPEDGSVPVPDRYDDALQVSVTADGLPFVESVLPVRTVTLTEAEGEGVDHEPSSTSPAIRVGWAVTVTKARGEASDAPMASTSTYQGVDHESPAASLAWAVTITQADGEAPDASVATTLTRQIVGGPSGPEPEAGLWAITKTSAPGEKPDR